LLAAHETFALLATQPNLGWRARLRHPSLKDLRAFRVKGFAKALILYLPVPGGVEIMRLFHGSRNLEALLGNEGFD